MFPRTNPDLDAWVKPGRDAFEYWVSFFPTAPLFGVAWRFGDVMPGFPGVAGSKAAPAKKDPAPSARARVEPSVPSKAKTTAQPPATPKAEAKPAAKAKAAAKSKTTAKAVATKAPAAPAAKKSTSGKTDDGRPATLLASKPEAVDDLKLIKGIGPALEKELNGLGLYKFEQMAGFAKGDFQWIDDNLTAFKGRCFRDDWSGQAKALMA